MTALLKPHSRLARKQARKAAAEKRQAKAEKRDPALQLRRLDRRKGVGKKGAQKERARLLAKIEGAAAA